MTTLINPLTQLPVTSGELRDIADLVSRQVVLEAEIANLEAQVALKKEVLSKLSSQTIPDAMNAIGMRDFTLSNGQMVELKKYYSAKIPEGGESAAFLWLRQNNHDSIIKHFISVGLGKGLDKEALKLKTMLNKAKIIFEEKESIHPQTLKAFVKEQMESGKDFPGQLFGAYSGNVTKIVTPKTK